MPSLVELARNLEGRKEGQSWRCLCPVHGGRSLIASEGRNSNLVVNCKSGCSQDEVIAALRERGLWGDEPSAEPIPFPDRTDLVAEYDYGPAVKGRFRVPGGKTFRWRLAESAEWSGLGKLKEKDLPLYRVSDLEDGPVWFCEGEKAAEACWAVGLQAVCLPGGASTQPQERQLVPLHGREVILWPDNDDQGRELMRRVAHQLSQPAIVHPEVPPAGDAYDYFERGGTVEALLALVERVRTEPSVERLLDGYHVTLPDVDLSTHWEFRHIESKARSFEAEVTAWMEGPGLSAEPFDARLNLLSLSGRESFRRQLDEMFGKREWTPRLNRACRLVRETYQREDNTRDLALVEPRSQELFYRVAPLFPDAQHAVLFGDGSAGKSYLMYWIALMVATGQVEAFSCLPQRVYWLDYETDAETARYRIDRLLAGLGLGWQPGLIDYRHAEGRPLFDIAEQLAYRVRERDVGLLVIDHGAAACAGEPEKAESALRYFNALSAIPCTTVTICHVSQETARNSAQLRPFGSAFWHNFPRITWNVQKQQEEGGSVMHLGLFNRKPASDAPPQSALGIRIEFEEGGGPVRIEREDVRETPELDRARSLPSQVYDALRTPMTPKGICTELGYGESMAEQVRDTLHRLKRRNRVIQVGTEGREILWAKIEPTREP